MNPTFQKEPMKTEGAYIIKRIGKRGGGQYVAEPGRKHSYTNRANARRFYSRIEAEKNLCVLNEVVIAI
jgi:hypothetical protein